MSEFQLFQMFLAKKKKERYSEFINSRKEIGLKILASLTHPGVAKYKNAFHFRIRTFGRTPSNASGYAERHGHCQRKAKLTNR